MNTSQRSFALGEVGPALYARSDVAAYRTALRTLRNATVKRTGGVQSRPGTEYLTTTRAAATERLASIVFDDADSFVVGFGYGLKPTGGDGGYVRFYKNGAPISVPLGTAWANTTVYAVGAVVNHIPGSFSIAQLGYLCIQAHTSVASVNEPFDGSDWEDYWHPLTDLPSATIVGTGPFYFELPTPYAADELFDLQVRGYQLDTVPVVHPNHAPRALVRYGTDSQWTFDPIDFTLDPLIPQNLTVTGTGGSGWGYRVTAIVDGQESGALAAVRTDIVATFDLQASVFDVLNAAPRTVNWDPVPGASKYLVYANTSAADSGFYVHEVFTDSFVDNGTVWPFIVGSGVPLFNPPALAAGAAPFSAAGDYPGVVGAYQQRLLLAGTDNAPDVVNASRTANPYNFFTSSPLVDSDPVQWRQVGPRLNRVRHFVEIAQRLVQFSSIGESIIQGDGDAILVPGAVNPRQVSEHGAARSPEPLVLGDTALFVQARGTQVRDLFAVESTLMGGNELSLTAAHLLDGFRVVDWCYQQTPDPTVWMVRSDGTLLSLTYERPNGIFAWAKHDTRASAGPGKFLSVACIPEGGRDTVYAVMEQTIQSVVRRWVVRMTDRAVPNPVCVDAAVRYAGTATATITGLGHLNGESVAVVVNGTTVLANPNDAATPATITVSGGQVTLPSPQTDVVVGLPYTVDVETLDIDAGGVTIKERGLMVGGVDAWVENTGTFYAGPYAVPGNTNAGLEAVVPRDAEGNALGRGTGYVSSVVLSAYNNTGRVFLRHVDPQPFTLLALVTRGHFGGR
jgi:hypothetical protein